MIPSDLLHLLNYIAGTSTILVIQKAMDPDGRGTRELVHRIADHVGACIGGRAQPGHTTEHLGLKERGAL